MEAPLRTPWLWVSVVVVAGLAVGAAGAPPPAGAVPIATGVVPEASRAPLRAHTPLQGTDEAPYLTADGLRTLAAWGLQHIVLRNPGRMLENADSWNSRAVFNWLRDVRACQPSFVPEAERYHDYYAFEDCPTPEDDRMTAFVLARLPRDANSVKQMWDAVSETVLAGFTADQYASSGARDTVDVLRRAHHRVMDGRDAAALTEMYARLVAEGGLDAGTALYGKEAGTLDYWGTTFWLRRHHEGNAAVVAGILDGLAARYAPPPPPGAVYIQGIGVRLRSKPSVDADPVAVLTIGAACARTAGDAPGWVPVRCDGRDGWVFGALVGPTPPDPDAIERSAADPKQPADQRLQLALRASALHPDQAYPAGLVVGAFKDVEIARVEQLARAGGRVVRERRVPCPFHDDPEQPEAWYPAMREAQAWTCIATDIGRGGQWYTLLGVYKQPWFVGVAARDGRLVVTSGRATVETDQPSRYDVLYEGDAGAADTVLAERLAEIADGS